MIIECLVAALNMDETTTFRSSESSNACLNESALVDDDLIESQKKFAMAHLREHVYYPADYQQDALFPELHEMDTHCCKKRKCGRKRRKESLPVWKSFWTKHTRGLVFVLKRWFDGVRPLLHPPVNATTKKSSSLFLFASNVFSMDILYTLENDFGWNVDTSHNDSILSSFTRPSDVLCAYSPRFLIHRLDEIRATSSTSKWLDCLQAYLFVIHWVVPTLFGEEESVS